jgi:hypothetical protein
MEEEELSVCTVSARPIVLTLLAYVCLCVCTCEVLWGELCEGVLGVQPLHQPHIGGRRAHTHTTLHRQRSLTQESDRERVRQGEVNLRDSRNLPDSRRR